MIIEKQQSVKNSISDILLAVKWAHISTHYFEKSRSWFSQRLNGYDGNNLENSFTEQERVQLKRSLLDLSDRIKRCAENL